MTQSMFNISELTSEARIRLQNAVCLFLDNYLNNDYTVSSIEYVTGQVLTYVLRITFVTQEKSKIFYLKLGCRVSEGCREFVETEYYYNTLAFNKFGELGESSVSESVGHDKANLAFFVKEIEGVRLDILLIRSLRPYTSKKSTLIANHYCELSAQWLKQFQKIVIPEHQATTDTIITYDERIAVEIEDLLKADKNALDKKKINQILSFTKESISHLDKLHYGSAAKHNDYGPWNIIVKSDGNGIAVIDFANVLSDSRFYDAYYFANALDSFVDKPFVSKSHLVNLKQNFLGCYGISRQECQYVSPIFNALFLLKKIRYIYTAINSLPQPGFSSHVRQHRNKALLNKYINRLNNLLISRN